MLITGLDSRNMVCTTTLWLKRSFLLPTVRLNLRSGVKCVLHTLQSFEILQNPSLRYVLISFRYPFLTSCRMKKLTGGRNYDVFFSNRPQYTTNMESFWRTIGRPGIRSIILMVVDVCLCTSNLLGNLGPIQYR